MGINNVSEISDKDQREWEFLLTHEHRTIFSILPTDPRCQICRIPFAGPGGVVGRILGFKRWNKNPTMCNRCIVSMPKGGIEVDTSVLFADIRGSTAMAERLGPARFASLLTHYYKVATDVLVPKRAVIDKMIGDEAMALFLPLAGPDYRRSSVQAAVELQRAVQEAEWAEEKPRIGIGVFAGDAFVGRIGESAENDFTALGDTVNVASRLQTAAGPDQIVLGEDLYTAASDLLPTTEAKTLEVEGREEPVSVRICTV